MFSWKFLTKKDDYNLHIVSFYTGKKTSWNSERTGNQVFKNIVTYQSIDQLLKVKPINIEYDLILLSVSDFNETKILCQKLKPKTHLETLVLVDASFGVYFEGLILEFLPHLMVLSVLCDPDIKLIKKFNYQIINEPEYFTVRVGFSCFPLYDYFNDEKLIAQKTLESNGFLSGLNTTLDQIMENLDGLKLIKHQTRLVNSQGKNDDSCQSLCSFIWINCLKKISLEVMSIIFEEFNYEHFLTDLSIRPIFSDLVKELLEIATKCGAPDVSRLLDGDVNEPCESLVKSYTKEQLQLMKDSFETDPIFLSHSEILYSFAHDLNYPLTMLMLQPLIFSSCLELPNSSIGFLYGICKKRLEEGDPKLYKKVTMLSNVNPNNNGDINIDSFVPFPVLQNHRQSPKHFTNSFREPHQSQTDASNSSIDTIPEDAIVYYDIDQIPTFNNNNGISDDDDSEGDPNADSSDYEDALSRLSVSSAGTDDGTKLLTTSTTSFKTPKHRGMKRNVPIKPKPKRKKGSFLALPTIKWSGSQFVRSVTRLQIVSSTKKSVFLKFTKMKVLKSQRRQRAFLMSGNNYGNYHIDTIELADTNYLEGLTGGILDVTTSRYGYVDSTRALPTGGLRLNTTSSRIRETESEIGRPTSGFKTEAKNETEYSSAKGSRLNN